MQRYDIKTLKLISSCMTAYLIECVCKKVNLYNHMPKMQTIKNLVGENNFFNPGDQCSLMKQFYHGRILIDDIDLNFLLAKNQTQEILTPEIKKLIESCADGFVSVLNEQNHYDIIFGQLPEATPFITVFSHDPDLNLHTRLFIGSDFASNTQKGLFEFYALIIDRMRFNEETQQYMNVEVMTREERLKYDTPN